MPTPLLLPYPPLVVLECGAQITWSDFSSLETGWIERGASICITARAGHPRRGGYFFHLRLTQNGIALRSFDRDRVLVLESEQEVVEFFNHSTGRLYSERMWNVSEDADLKIDQ
jgi:hypothetical protein